MLDMGEVLDISEKVIGAGQPPCVLFFSNSFIRGSHICIVPVFLNIPAFQALYVYIYICIYICIYIYIYIYAYIHTHIHTHTYIHTYI
jgi:hypothetical protein